MNPALSIVLPCYNEAKNLPLIITRLRQVIGARNDVEVLLVNNGSRDESEAVLTRELAAPSLAFIRVVQVPVNQGYGYGIMAGLRAAKGDFLAWTHADMQTDPADVLLGFERILSAAEPENVLLKGRRLHRNPLDAFFTFGMSIIASLALRCWLHDINAQPKIFSRRFFNMLTAPPDDFSLDLYVLFLARKRGFEVLAQPVSFKRRLHGIAKGGGTLTGKWRLIRRTWSYIFKLRREISSGLR